MSRINGEKARSAIAKRNRTAQRVKDRARLAEIRAGNAAKGDAAGAAKSETKAEAKPAAEPKKKKSAAKSADESNA